MLSRIWRRFREAIRRYFIAGLLAFAPIGITLWVTWWIIRKLDNLLLPPLLRLLFPNLESAPSLPPLVGALFTFLVILLSGVIVRHFFGQELVRLGERLLSRVPIARSIYHGVKQLFEAIVASNDEKSGFNRVVLIEYPRKGVYALAFTTGRARGALPAATSKGDLVNCFVPTTPNPTSGFYLVVPESELYEVALSVEDAFKVIMSAGLVSPGGKVPPLPSTDKSDTPA